MISEPTHVKADIIPYSAEYSSVVRSWVESEETYFNVCRGKEFPPPDELVDSWQRSDVSAFLLFSDNRPVAYGELWTRPNERSLEINHLLVDPYKRLQGYGTKMLELLFQRGAERQNVARVVVNLYNDSEAALGCYLKAGFELLSTATHTLGLKMVRLVRK
jgi:RimJ/RimL family protein N-acetyltransferase